MRWRLPGCVAVAAAAVVSGDIDWSGPLPTLNLAPPALARIGHPLTPLSYAGVARRTARRTVRRTAVRLSTLPAGCVYGTYYGGAYYNCHGVYYQLVGGVYVQVIVE